MKKAIVAAKLIVLVCLACLLMTTYILRGGILTLVNHLIESDDIVEAKALERFTESADDRKAAYEASLARYEVEVKRYRELLKLYQEDFEAYEAQTREGRPIAAPPVPRKPNPPRTPEVQEQLAEVNSAFRQSRKDYFARATRLNYVVGLCGIGLVGGIVFLIMFDPDRSRLAYLVLLVVSFVFIIGPALHSAMTFMAYGLQPRVYYESPVYYDEFQDRF